MPQVRFSRGTIENRNVVRVICHLGTESEGDRPTTTLLKWTAGKPFSYFRLPWVASAISIFGAPDPNVFVLNSDGIVGFGYGTFSQEMVDASREGPSGRGPLRDVRCLGSRVYVVGMARQVYFRERGSGWRRADDGIVLPLGEIRVAGLNSIDGVPGKRLWAVGFLGEIWSQTDRSWEQIDSPTNVTLHRVITPTEQLVFACGQLGVLLRSEGLRWQVVEHYATTDDFWDLAWFDGSLYVASRRTLFRLEGDELIPIDVPGVTTFGHLDAADGVLWSFGTRHICWTSDGRDWHDETPAAT
jgi:hypothetical protein